MKLAETWDQGEREIYPKLPDGGHFLYLSKQIGLEIAPKK